MKKTGYWSGCCDVCVFTRFRDGTCFGFSSGNGGGGIVSDDGGWTKEKMDDTDNGIEILDMYSAGVLF